MEKFDGGMILAWLVLSFIFTILTMALFLFLSPPLQYGGCSFVYSNNDEIAFTGFDPLGNIYLVIFTDSTFDEVNSTYPYVTTLHPIPANATSRIYAVAKFSADMSLLWARIIGAPQGEFVWFRSFAITQDGGLVMYGTGTDIFTSMPEKDLGYVLKLDNEGELDFVHTWPHLDENLGIRSFDDTGEFITVPYHLPDTGNANYLETSGMRTPSQKFLRRDSNGPHISTMKQSSMTSSPMALRLPSLWKGIGLSLQGFSVRNGPLLP